MNARHSSDDRTATRRSRLRRQDPAGRHRGVGRARRPRSERSVATGLATLLVASVVVIAPAVTGVNAASAAPGNPGTPSDPTTLYTEPFENGLGASQVLLNAYTGAAPANETYTAANAWLTGCNGEIVEFNTPYTDLGNCASTTDTSRTRQLAYALGAHAGAATPATNHAVTAYTDGNPGANAVEFQTVNPISLSSATGRYLTFSVDAAAQNCPPVASAPSYQFALLNGTTPTNVGGAINPCASGTGYNVPAVGNQPAQSVSAGTYTSNGSVLFNGSAFGLRMINANGSGGGNDAAFDNIKVLDVTPQLDKAFSPASIETGQTSKLTFTITNTSELAAKNGWSFTDALPAGLTVTSPAATTTCPAGVVTGAAGATSVKVTGNLSAGMASCTATVNVTANDTGTYTNGPDNVTETGLNPPGDTTLTVTEPPAWTCSSFGYLFQTPSAATHQIIQVDLVTGASTQIGSTPDNVNAVGYNTLDDYIYGWDSTTNSLARIGSDGAETSLGVPAGMDTSIAYQVGDFDDAGHLYLQYGGNGTLQWFEIDLAPGSSTYGQVLSHGTATKPASAPSMPSDWTFVNGAFYGAVGPTTAAGAAHLIKFVPSTNTTTDVGTLAGTGAEDSTYGAAYADAAGNVYFSNNSSGHIYRVNPTTRATIKLSNGPASGGNDGARCATAPIPTITLVKDVPRRFADGDEFTVGLQGPGGATLTSATTTGTDTTATTTDWPVSQGATYTLTDAMAAGSPSALTDYIPTIVCTDTTTGDPVDTGGDPAKWTLTVDGTDAYSCTITNSPNDNPKISVVKSASPSDAASFKVGAEITYSFVVSNTGNVPLTDVTVDDSDFSGTGTLSPLDCPETSLAAGDQETCTATYTVTQADVDAGSITNSATATGTPPAGDTPPTSPPSTTTVPADQEPGLTVAKSADPATVGKAGDTVTYDFLLTNTGNVTLTDPTVTDTEFSGTGTLSPVTCPADASPLLPGATATCTATYTVTQADADAGTITNTATASANDPDGDPVAAPPSDATVDIPADPELTLVKTADPATVTAVGDTVTYTYTITNTGNVTITDPTVDETLFTGSGTAPVPTCPTGVTLAPGDSGTCTATYTLTQDDVDAGSVTNSATASGTPPAGDTPPTSPPSTATVTATPEPALTVVKTADPATVTAAGQTITYSFLVTNTGNVTINDVSVDDSDFSGTGTLSPVTCPDSTLAVGADETCTATYTTTQADVDAGKITNSATASGTDPGGDPTTSPPSTSTVTAPPTPGITVTKSADPATVGKAGDTVTYSFAVTNTGNVTLTDITIDDSDFSGTGTLGPVSCPATSLAPGLGETCTASYTVTQADADAGTITNSATATGTPPGSTPPPVSPPSTSTVTIPPAPAITVTKSASPTDAAKYTVGQTITYSFAVTNTGNVTLTDVAVDDSDFSGTGTLGALTCPGGGTTVATLAPGADATCTADYTLTQADVDAGKVTNSATATGTPPGTTPPPVSPPSTVTIPTPPKPSLSVVKTASPGKVAKAGQKITYSFAVTNTGNVTLTDVTVKDQDFTGTGKLSAITCPASGNATVATLAPGASTTCTASYTVTQADVDAGSVKNSAVVSGDPPGGTPPVSSPPSTVTVPSTAVGKLTLVKTAHTADTNGDGITDAGDTITWTLVVTNVGTATVHKIKVTDPTAGTVTCPATSLAPGQAMTCSVPKHSITAADATAGSVHNVATASGSGIDGASITAKGQATVDVDPAPSTGLASTGNDTQLQVILAGLLLAGGALLTLTGRRRRRLD